jgi:hypothetical protein
LLLGQCVDNMQVGLPLFLYMYPLLKLFSSFKLSFPVQIKYFVVLLVLSLNHCRPHGMI